MQGEHCRREILVFVVVELLGPGQRRQRPKQGGKRPDGHDRAAAFRRYHTIGRVWFHVRLRQRTDAASDRD